MSLAPASSSSKVAAPSAASALKLAADHTEKRPPTQSHIGSTSAAPKARAAASFAVTA